MATYQVVRSFQQTGTAVSRIAVAAPTLTNSAIRNAIRGSLANPGSPLLFIMRGNVISPPQTVYWLSQGQADPTGALSGFFGNITDVVTATVYRSSVLL